MFTKLVSSLIIPFFLLSSSTEDFFSSFDILKFKDWEKLTTLGEKALEEKGNPKIHARLATSYFYLGRYEEMKKHVDQCLEHSLDEESNDLLVQTLYLLSAYHRSQSSYTEARNVIEKALHKVRSLDNSVLLAKVLYNAGAAEEEDPKGNLDLAKQYFEEALTLHDPHSNDCHRVLLHLGKVHLLKNAPSVTTTILSKLSNEKLFPRTQAHFFSLSAQLALAKGNKEEATLFIDKGLALAEQLHMTTDIKRLKMLREQIHFSPNDLAQ